MYKKSLTLKNIWILMIICKQFILFKLKVADAVSEGYDTTASFRNELNGYRNQLAGNYLTDTTNKGDAAQKSLSEIP